jgi:chaperonin GroES
MKSKIEPLEDRVLLETDEPKSVTPGGMLLPERSKEKPSRGIVIAVGPGKTSWPSSQRQSDVQ